MEPHEQTPIPALYLVASNGGLLNFQTILYGRPTTESPRLSSRPFQVLDSEKISVDVGPWIRHLRSADDSGKKHNYQLRIRSSKHGRSYTLRRIIVKIVNLVKSILDAASYRYVPDLSCWYLVWLRKKPDVRNHCVAFECFFVVQGRRLVLSTEDNVDQALHGLSLPYQIPPLSVDFAGAPHLAPYYEGEPDEIGELETVVWDS